MQNSAQLGTKVFVAGKCLKTRADFTQAIPDRVLIQGADRDRVRARAPEQHGAGIVMQLVPAMGVLLVVLGRGVRNSRRLTSGRKD